MGVSVSAISHSALSCLLLLQIEFTFLTCVNQSDALVWMIKHLHLPEYYESVAQCCITHKK